MSEWLFGLFFINYYHYIYNVYVIHCNVYVITIITYITLVCMCGSTTFRQIPRSGAAALEGQKLNEHIVGVNFSTALPQNGLEGF